MIPYNPGWWLTYPPEKSWSSSDWIIIPTRKGKTSGSLAHRKTPKTTTAWTYRGLDQQKCVRTLLYLIVKLPPRICEYIYIYYILLYCIFVNWGPFVHHGMLEMGSSKEVTVNYLPLNPLALQAEVQIKLKSSPKTTWRMTPLETFNVSKKRQRPDWATMKVSEPANHTDSFHYSCSEP